MADLLISPNSMGQVIVGSLVNCSEALSDPLWMHPLLGSKQEPTFTHPLITTSCGMA
jgi:hypothetical protein